MPVNINLPQGAPVAGIELVTLSAGIKNNGTPDMVVARIAEGSTCAAVFTQSAFCAAPVTVCKQQLHECAGAVRALLINSGNANAGTGEPGIVMARGHCDAVANALSIPSTAVLPFSTGVIGQLLPDDVMLQGIAKATDKLATENTSDLVAWQAAATGIMTTDTVPKLTSQSVEVAGQLVTISGMAKGSGMIQPDMATLLSYVFTDAAIRQDHLEDALREVVSVSFNAITVDSDTSTNDSCVLIATGTSNSDHTLLNPEHAEWPVFMQALRCVFTDLAQAIVRDAEGASKFISVNVDGGKNADECKLVAYAIANSPLVKTAMFASDANVGRLLMAIGKAGVENLDASGVTVMLGDVMAFEAGGIAHGYTEERGATVMACEEIDVFVSLGRGAASATVYTSDLSHDYVSINADYRS
ncbi:MAG: bifunctional glutamate N-acetyltransferase/amino-acid acetyltransferase ArgJ [Granulosicoccus sp.]